MQLSCRDGEAGFVLVFVRLIQRITNAITRPVDCRNSRVDESDTERFTPSSTRRARHRSSGSAPQFARRGHVTTSWSLRTRRWTSRT